MPDTAPTLDALPPATLAEVLATIEATPALTAARQRDLHSALNRLHSLTRQPLSDLPAAPRAVAAELAALDRSGSGLTSKTRRNLASNLLAGLRLADCAAQAFPALTGTWHALHAALPTPRLRHGLSRFLRVAHAHEWHPERITDADVAVFVGHLEQATLLSDKDIRDRARHVPRLWNEAAAALSELSLPLLTVPDRRQPPQAPALAAYPSTFQMELSDYAAWLQGERFLADPPPQLQKASTAALRREQIRLAAGALVAQGRSPAAITDLAVLVEPAAVRAIAETYYARADGFITAFLRGLITTLVAVARDWVRVDAATLAELKDLRRRLGTTPTGMTDKNRQLIRRFDDPGVRAALYDLPDRLLAEAQHMPGARGATRAQIALAIAILTWLPIRVANLAALRLDHHLVRDGRGWRIYLNPDEVKNAQPLTYTLPAPLTSILENYLARFRLLLQAAGTGLLFPSGTANGASKRPTTLSAQIQTTIARHLGFSMTAHQFRHLAAKLYLERVPGDYVTVQRLLGHRNLKTTTNFYAELRTEQAGLSFATMLEADRAAHMGRRRARR